MASFMLISLPLLPPIQLEATGLKVCSTNKQYMPQVWRVRPGDILTVTLHNQLSDETNLHFHGLNVSPLDNGDNVFLHIAPGQTFTYEIKIPERASRAILVSPAHAWRR